MKNISFAVFAAVMALAVSACTSAPGLVTDGADLGIAVAVNTADVGHTALTGATNLVGHVASDVKAVVHNVWPPFPTSFP